jgi:hypothetical protein
MNMPLQRDSRRAGELMAGRSMKILGQVDSLIDDLLNDSDVSSSALASILMAARESVRDGYHVALARHVWDANNDLKLRQAPAKAAAALESGRND